MRINKNIDLLQSYNPDVTLFNSGDFTKFASQALASIGTGVSGTQSMLLMQQQELQREMMITSMQSNILRTEHETKMAAVRNMRVA